MNDPRAEPGATPALGSLDQLDFARPPRRGPEPPRPRRRRAWPWGLLVLLVLALAAVLALNHWREQIGERLVPDSAINLEIAQAHEAMLRGDLSKADGSGARERYQAVLARDPDHLAARMGLASVRDAALAQARAAMAAGDPAKARARIELARAMAAPADELAKLEAILVRVESTGADVAGMLDRARAAQAEGRLEQIPDGALALYSEVLQLQPDNALALEGRRDILSGLLEQAQGALDEGQVAVAEALVARVVEADPSHLELPALKARLGEAQQRRDRDREVALARADGALEAGGAEAAAAIYLEVLGREPGSVEAREGLDRAAAMLAARAGREAADFDFEAAEASLALAHRWQPMSPAVVAARTRLEEARAARGELPAATDPGEVQALLRQAQSAMQRGDLIEPPGEAAWDHLRRVAAIEPGSPALARALVEYDRRARACFEDELAGNRLGRAQACLDARAVRERGASLASDRRRLADRWLAFAEERLGANELALARRAMDSAQALAPDHPGLTAMAERLRRAEN